MKRYLLRGFLLCSVVMFPQLSYGSGGDKDAAKDVKHEASPVLELAPSPSVSLSVSGSASASGTVTPLTLDLTVKASTKSVQPETRLSTALMPLSVGPGPSPSEVDEKRRSALLDIPSLSLSAKRPSEVPIVPSLHIYGGGVRGIIPATILRELEAETGMKALNMFEFFSGTSTGGILAGAINTGRFTAADLVNLYKEHASTIFESRYWLNPWGIRGPNYKIANLRDVLRQYVGVETVAQFKKDVLIPMYDIRGHNTLVVKSWEAREHPDQNFWAVDALSGTGAAPTYFEPVRMYNCPGDPGNRLRREFIVVDGGIFDNASTGCAFNAMKSLYGHDVRHISVSLGTGIDTPEHLTYEDVSGMGTLSLAPRTIDWMLTANVQKTEYEMKRYLPPIGDFQQYFLFNPMIDHQYAAMDATDEDHLDQLEQYGIDLVAKESISTSVMKMIRQLEDLREDGLLAKKIKGAKRSESELKEKDERKKAL